MILLAWTVHHDSIADVMCDPHEHIGKPEALKESRALSLLIGIAG